MRNFGVISNVPAMTRSPASTRNLSVCLLASHPLVLAEFQRVLSHTSVRVQPKQVQPLLSDEGTIPRAGVYVIDFEGNRVATEALVARIMEQFPDSRLLVVGSDFNDEIAFPLLRVGVKGLLEHGHLTDQLERALQSVANGGYWVPRTLLSRFVDAVLKKGIHGTTMSPRTGLSRREKEVVQGLLDNLSNKEIASKLYISERTVKFHVSNLLQKFNVRRRADLIVLAFQEWSGSMSFATVDANKTVQ